MKNLNSIIIIPARKGSKGLPNKNIKKLQSKPLIKYSIEFALKIKKNNDIICVSSDDERIEKIVENIKNIEFIKRPKNISNDTTPMESVIKHSLNEFEKKNISFNSIILLQPTSPIRKIIDYKNLIRKFNKNIDMVVSVREAKENPYYSLYEEDHENNLIKSKYSEITRRQDAPKVYCLNGSFFMINTDSLKKKSISNFSKIKKVVMPYNRSIDIDSIQDWNYIKFLVESKKLNLK